MMVELTVIGVPSHVWYGRSRCGSLTLRISRPRTGESGVRLGLSGVR
jgi:hypothetical protein